MGQPLVADFTEHIRVPQEVYQSLRFLPAALAEGQGDRPFVVASSSFRPRNATSPAIIALSTKEPHRLSSVLVPLLTRRLLDHLEHEDIEECEIYWQGGEAMIMGPAWFADAGKLMDSAAAAPGQQGRGRLSPRQRRTLEVSRRPFRCLDRVGLCVGRVARSV
jgi:hypothetical protein